MATKAKNLDFDKVVTTVNFDTEANLVTCGKTFYTSDGSVTFDLITFDLRIMPLQVALQMAAGYVQMCTLTEYE